MRYYTLVVRHNLHMRSDNVFVDDHVVFNDVTQLYNMVKKLNNMFLLKPVRIEESIFKDGKLVCYKVLRDFLKEQRQAEKEYEEYGEDIPTSNCVDT